MAHPKSELVDRTQKNDLGKPSYRTRNEGSAHEPVFKTEVLIQGVIVGRGEGIQKRQAERQAAEAALAYLSAHGDQVTPETGGATGRFEGPWPIFPEVLAASLTVANSRVGLDRPGVADVRDLALGLYKDLLESLGEVLELPEEPTA